MNESTPKPTLSLSDLPPDELRHYGRELGLRLTEEMEPGELLRRVRDRQTLLLELDREAMLEICVWARRPVRQSASKEQLAKEIAEITRMQFDGLAPRSLVALARLRGVSATEHEDPAVIAERLVRAEPWRDRLRRKRRSMMGSLISRIVEPKDSAPQGEYQFLPEDSALTSLKEQIAERGIVGGIARRIRGAADDYVHEKLNEIEARIDAKLDEIDRRLGEWRDREVANRLKIIKITLIASILVAILSLGYSEFRRRVASPSSPAPTSLPSPEMPSSAGTPGSGNAAPQKG